MSTVAKLARYSLVSIISTTTSAAVLAVLVVTATTTAGWANVIATAIGTVPSFELNRRWVWRVNTRRSVRSQVLPFCALAFVGLGLSTLAVHAATAWATSAGATPTVRALVALAANVATFGSLWVLQFIVLDRVLFTRRPPAPVAVLERRADSARAA